MKFIKVLYVIGAVLLLFGAASRLFLQDIYSYIYMAGAVIFAVSQFLLRPKGDSVALRRLIIQQQLAGILFIAAGVLMFTHTRNEWMVVLTCGALTELYTAFRIPQEQEKENK
ncbi:MAG: hypothetical protein J6U58_00110 [Bacteroidaceae bacterium]|nr:hypothetical protein [Bacteroidaceae bacterium]